MKMRFPPQPPPLARRLLEIFADRDDKAAMLGDLEEEFAEMASRRGVRRARLWYRIQVALSFPAFVKNLSSGSAGMIKNFTVVTLRIIKRHRGFSFLNIAGLTVGMTATLLIGIFIHHELSFDRHHEKAGRIFRVGVWFGLDIRRGAYTAPPMAQALKDELPEIEQVVRMSLWPRKYQVRSGEKSFLEKGIIYADGTIFEVFTIPMTAGDPQTALTEPNTVVLSGSTAQKYFGSVNPVGSTLHFEDLSRDMMITGVIEDCPATSHFQFDMIVSLNSSAGSHDTSWRGHTYFTYILLKEGMRAETLEAKFPDFVGRHWGAQVEEETGMSLEALRREGQYHYGYVLEPLTDIHLNRSVVDNLSKKGSRSSLLLFSTIAVFILLIAGINFMNLSTARFAHRCKEVGVRKVLGSGRRPLVFQFLGESCLLAFISTGLALLISVAVLPAFGKLADRDLTLFPFTQVSFWLLLASLVLVVGLFAGSYPAFCLSALPPLRSLRHGFVGRSRGPARLRRALVVFQFVITFSIFFGTLVIWEQLRFLQNRDLGFDREQVVVIHRASALRERGEAFKQELLQYPEILMVSRTDTLPGRHYDPNGHRLEGRPANEEHTIYTMYADHEFVKLLNLEITAGRNFSPEEPADLSSAVIINQTAAKELRLDDPIGKRFHKEFGGAGPGEFVSVIGVVKDFHFHSLHQPILPMIIRPLTPRDWFYTCIKLRSADLTETLALIEKTWASLSGGRPFEYSFLDEDFDRLYRRERRSGEILAIFALIAVTIACLGLFGLISFAAEKRTKEIGIRKVLGSGIPRILILLSQEVLLLVSGAILISTPLAYYFMHRWLENFAFRTNITPAMFLIPAGVTLVIALLSVSYQALKAALADPVKALRYE